MRAACAHVSGEYELQVADKKKAVRLSPECSEPGAQVEDPSGDAGPLGATGLEPRASAWGSEKGDTNNPLPLSRTLLNFFRIELIDNQLSDR